MFRGFWKLTWVETKVFMREPMGVIATLIAPVVVFLLLGSSIDEPPGAGARSPFNVAIFAALLIPVSAVISLVAIISIYREGGILKRLRATPLSPIAILGAHVVTKLLFTVASLVVLLLVGRRMIPATVGLNPYSFAPALLLSTVSILSLGFLIASVVPTARFAQPITAAFMYPMIAVSGLFFPLEILSRPLQMLTLALPTTHAVILMRGIWDGRGWSPGSAVALVLIFVVCTAVSARVFRWQ